MRYYKKINNLAKIDYRCKNKSFKINYFLLRLLSRP